MDTRFVEKSMLLALMGDAMITLIESKPPADVLDSELSKLERLTEEYRAELVEAGYDTENSDYELIKIVREMASTCAIWRADLQDEKRWAAIYKEADADMEDMLNPSRKVRVLN